MEKKQASSSICDIPKEYIEYQTHLKELVVKSQDAFEKQLSYLSAGSLTISLAFIKDVVGDLSATSRDFILIMAWSLMALTLLVNLLSHIFTSNVHNKTIMEISDRKYTYKKALTRYNRIKKLNYFSIFTLITGIICLICFISINI